MESVIFSLDGRLQLLEEVKKQCLIKELDVPFGVVNHQIFSDGEINVDFATSVRGKRVYLLTSPNSSDYILQLNMAIDAAKRAAANEIIPILPYFPYARQDKKDQARGAIGAKVIAEMLENRGATHVITFDLHADQIQGFFHIPVDNVYGSPVMLDDIKARDYNNLMVVSPDVGGVVRARAIAKKLNDAELSIIDKRRTGPNKSEVMHIIGEPKGRDCLIVDDIVDTAGTLCTAAAELKKNGAHKVIAYITHPVLSGPAVDNINHSELDEIIVTNTIPLSEAAKASPKIRQLDLSAILAKTIKRVNGEDSLSSMFED